MDDAHRLLAKFHALADALDVDLTARERAAAGRLAAIPTRDELMSELGVHRDALALANKRQRDADIQWSHALERRDHAALEHIENVQAEIAREIPLLRKAIADLERGVEALRTATS